MKILVIDDRKEELENGKKAVEENGWECITCNPTSEKWMPLINEVDGIVTDMFWNYSNHGEKPSGLLVVIQAISLGKPIVVCTKAGDYYEGHHGKELAFINDGYISTTGRVLGPFGWNDEKDWRRAVNILSHQFKKKGGDK